MISIADVKKEKEDFLKTSLEDIGLQSDILLSLKNSNIGTIGEVIEKEDENLIDNVGLNLEELNLIKEKINKSFDTFLSASISDNLNTKDINHRRLDGVEKISAIEDIVQFFAEKFGVEKAVIIGKSRKQEIVLIRDVITYFLREYAEMSYPAIGKLLGNRDHTTIIHSYNKTKNNIKNKDEFESNFLEIALKAKTIKERKEYIKDELIPLVSKFVKNNKNIFIEISDREKKILELYREGITLDNISEVIGVTRERIRQIVIKTIKQQAVNESLEKGIVLNSEVLIEEERKRRQIAKNSKKNVKEKKLTLNRWSRYYLECKECKLTTYKHYRNGLCEKCGNKSVYGTEREAIVREHSGSCDVCHIGRVQSKIRDGRDFYISYDRKQVLCRKCFSKFRAQKLGHYKNYEWSRFYPKCVSCGTDKFPHFKKGLCINCSPDLTPDQREVAIILGGGKCLGCGLSRLESKEKGEDLCVNKDNKVFCRSCHTKNNLNKIKK